MSNLLEEKHQEAWADLNPAEQKQILTRLMTALEENAVLLSDTFTQETNYPVVKNNICKCSLFLFPPVFRLYISRFIFFNATVKF